MHEEKHNKHHEKGQKHFLQKGSLLFLAFVAFCIIFAVAFYALKGSAAEKFQKANSEALGIKNYGSPQKTQDVFSKYGAAMGVGLGLIIMILSYILYGIASVVRATRFSATNPIIMILSYGLLLLLGIDLVFIENRYSTLGNGIISFIGYPLFYAGAAMVLTSVLLAVLAITKKRSGGHE